MVTLSTSGIVYLSLYCCSYFPNRVLTAAPGSFEWKVQPLHPYANVDIFSSSYSTTTTGI